MAFGTSLTVNNVSCGIARHLAATSDHLPLLATVGWANPPLPQGRLRPNTLDPTLFRQLLELGCGGLGPLPVSPSSEDLDKQAEVLVQIIHDAYCGAAKRALGARHGNPSWNDSCKEARKGYKIALRSSSNDSSVYDAQKAYRKTVQIAKTNFFKTKLERARTAKEIFGVTEWHKSTGTFCLRPLKDFRFPERSPVQSLAGKMEVLMQNLLANPSAVGNIPMDFQQFLQTHCHSHLLPTRKSKTPSYVLATPLLVQTEYPQPLSDARGL
ncbi:BgTH12-07554 [Blumeria graminis f. sp. triticale]|uniref:BgTH12-07554 n=1 Tax=Blumeria graminis f. sp. triticale TaxID=1689686 RepID=A0A9W4GCD1_BLUGR|nr:BgTH12-07554 [Blumeria graminis f. sp. triticale]